MACLLGRKQGAKVTRVRLHGLGGWWRGIGGCALAGGLTAGVPEAVAQVSQADCRPNPHLSRAKEELDRLEFDRSARTLQRAIEFSRNCRWDLAEIYRLKGYVDAVNAERERCQRAFEILLALDPQYVMPARVAPKIRSCFEDAVRVPSTRRELRLVHRVPGEVPPRAPVSLQVRLVDPLRLVDRVQVFFRRSGGRVYTLVSTRADDSVSVVIPALNLPAEEEAYGVEYLVRAIDRWEGTLVEEGSVQAPLRFSVRAGDISRGSVASRWWFWTALGVVAAVGAGVAVAAVTSGDDEITLGFRSSGVPGEN